MRGVCYEPCQERVCKSSHGACVPPGERIVFIGDSTIRYAYLGLVYALKRRRENCDFIHTGAHEHRYKTWTEFFNHTVDDLAPHEVCDCYRGMASGTFATHAVENRYFTLDAHNISVAYLSWYGNKLMRGYWWPGTPLPSSHPLPLRVSNGYKFAWEMNWLRAHVQLLAALRPTTVVMSGAAHHIGDIRWDLPITWKVFNSTIRAAVPEARIVWSTPTDNAVQGVFKSDRKFAERYFEVFDSFSLSQTFNRSRDWFQDRVHLRCRPTLELTRVFLRQLVGERRDGGDHDVRDLRQLSASGESRESRESESSESNSGGRDHGIRRLSEPSPILEELAHANAALNAHDDTVIDQLFERAGCEHAYLDMGTNYGVQLRKLYEPSLYPRSPIIRGAFRSIFGPPPWCNVCTIGFEPNPKHATRLRDLQGNLTAAGAPLHIFHAAVSDSLTTLPFKAEGGEAPWARKLHLNAALMGGANMYSRSGKKGNSRAAHSSGSSDGIVTVRTIDLARVVHRVNTLLERRHGGKRGSSRILMKLDIEGDEPKILLHLVRTQAACLIDQIMVEWHPLSMHNPRLGEMIKMTAPARAARAKNDPLASGVGALVNVSQKLRSSLVEALKDQGLNEASDCRTELNTFDDESFKADGRPYPQQAVCAKSHD